MPVFNRNRHSGSSGVAAAYTIENSIRFNPADSPKLSWTPSGAGNTKIFSLSFWMKRGNLGLGAYPHIFDAGGSENMTFGNSTEQMRTAHDGAQELLTTQLFRDPTAWMHVYKAWDTNQATAADRSRLFINGIKVTDLAGSTYPAEDDLFGSLGTAAAHSIGSTNAGGSYFDGYFAEWIGIDGTVYEPTDLGEFDTNGNWIPKDPSGLTFGTNGWWLDFAIAPGTGNGAGNDVSGNDNDWAETGLAANDKMRDSPSDSADDDIGNFCVLNPLSKQSSVTLSNGNLGHVGQASAATSSSFGTIGLTEGKWYWEMESASTANNWGTGIVNSEFDFKDGVVASVNGWLARYESTTVMRDYDEASQTNHTTGITAVQADRLCIAVDIDNLKIWGGIVDATDASTRWMDAGTGMTGNPGAGSDEFATIDGPPFFPIVHTVNVVAQLNFGQQAFLGTIPTGFKRLHTANLAAPAITDPSKYFQIDLFTGTGGELVRTLTDAGGGAVAPDLVWIKDRDTSIQHVVTDRVRGATKELNPDALTAESTVAEGVKSFNSSGYTLGTDATYNASSSLNVGWCWVMNGAGAANEEGLINTDATSANTTAGQTIISYTGNATASQTLGHGLNSAPEFLIFKDRDSADNWTVWHQNLSNPVTKSLNLDGDDTEQSFTVLDGVVPTSTLIQITDHNRGNKSSSDLMIWGWHGVDGYSKFGTYEGNADAEGAFIWLGFRPGLILSKSIDSTSRWDMQDGLRTINGTTASLEAAGPAAEVSNAGQIDILSNGFKHRTAADNNIAETYVYAAWAQFPFGGEDVSQARAR